MTVQTFFVDNGTGPADVGDCYATNGAFAFLNKSLTGWVGRNLKNALEADLFFRFDTSAIALGSVYNGVNVGWRTSFAAVGTGTFKIGLLLPDAIWDINGFATLAEPLPRYANGGLIPHASLDSSLSVIAGKIVFNAYVNLTGFQWNGLGADVDLVAGDGIGGEDFTTNFLTTFASSVRSVSNQEFLGVTFDSQAVANAQHRMLVYLTESGGAERPFLTVDWTENPPAFTSSPPLTGVPGTPYVYTAVANPWSLGDQTAGNHLVVNYTLPGVAGVDFPTGMTIGLTTGIVSWTPTGGQVGANSVTIRATNEGGLSVDQGPFIVEVGDPGQLRITGRVSAAATVGPMTAARQSAEISAGLSATTQQTTATASSPRITAAGQARQLSATFVRRSVTAETT